jgi:hypothetical protein
MVGPAPLSVKALMAGAVTMKVTGQVNPLLAAVTAAAGGFANVLATASVSVGVAAMGVSGALSLIKATAEAAASLDWSLCAAAWSLKASINLNALMGRLTAFVKIDLIFFTKTWNVTIANWPGIVKNVTLYNSSGFIAGQGC